MIANYVLFNSISLKIVRGAGFQGFHGMFPWPQQAGRANGLSRPEGDLSWAWASFPAILLGWEACVGTEEVEKASRWGSP